MSTEIGRGPKRRVVLSNMTRILAAIVGDLVRREPDLMCVGILALPDLPTAFARLRPDVVVLAPARSDPAREARDELRRKHPDLTVVELRPRDDRAVVWRPGSAPEHVDLSAGGIVAVLREPPRAEEGGADRPT